MNSNNHSNLENRICASIRAHDLPSLNAVAGEKDIFAHAHQLFLAICYDRDFLTPEGENRQPDEKLGNVNRSHFIINELQERERQAAKNEDREPADFTVIRDRVAAVLQGEREAFESDPEGYYEFALKEYKTGGSSGIPVKSVFAPFVPLRAISGAGRSAGSAGSTGRVSAEILFPYRVLPPEVSAIVSEISSALEVYPEMPGSLALGLLSYCVSDKFCISPTAAWTKEPLNLYMLIIAEPSERKTPCVKVLTAPIYEYEEEENFLRQDDIAHYRAKKAVAEAKADRYKRILRSGKGVESVSVSEIADNEKEITELENHPILQLRTIADDTTPESLMDLMHENGGHLAVVSAEGRFLSILSGAYSDGVAHAGNVLKAYSCEPIHIDRRSGTHFMIRRPHLSIAIAAQPSVLLAFMSNGTFAGEGLLARFLYCFPHSRVGSRVLSDQGISEGAQISYSSLLHRLLTLPTLEEPPEIRFSEEARQELARIYAENETALVSDLAGMKDWGGKYVGQVIRLTGILHICEHFEASAEVPVSLDTLQRAEDLGIYFREQAIQAYFSGGRYFTEEENDAATLWKSISALAVENDLAESTLYNRVRCNHFATVASLEPGLKILENHGYIARYVYHGEKTRGSKHIAVNPEAIKDI